MKRVSLTSLLSIFVVIQLCLPYRVLGEPEEDTWMEPDAWARDHLSLNALQSELGKCCPCTEETTCQPESNRMQVPSKTQPKATEDEVSLMYFKKFITLLFNRKKLKYDSKLQIYERSIVFTLQAAQLDKLHQLQDPRDLDYILTEIFQNVRIPYMSREGYTQHTTAASGFKALILDIFRDILQLIKTSEVRFLLIAMLVVIFGWYLSNRFNICWIPLFLGSLFICGFLHTYLECNRELEMTKMLEIINSNKVTQESQKDSGFFRFWRNIFSSSADSQNLEKQKLKKSTKISLGFCRPDHVLIIYINEIFLKNLQTLLELCTETLTKLKEGLPFPYNYFAGIMLICMIGYILKLTFKYVLSPANWVHLLKRNQTHPPTAPLIHQALNNTDTNSHNNDRLSGDNLRMLLNAINTVPQRNQIIPPPAVSGVEELKEALEAAPNQTCSSQEKEKERKSKSHKDTSSPSSDESSLQNNNVSKTNINKGDMEIPLNYLSENS